MLTFEEVVDAILNGVCDDHLDKLTSTIKKRRELQNEKKILFIAPGDKVRFNDFANPKYLRGHVVIVKKVNQSTVTVDMPDDYSLKRFRGSVGVRCPISIVDKVEDK